jgi:hypothetical protein
MPTPSVGNSGADGVAEGREGREGREGLLQPNALERSQQSAQVSPLSLYASPSLSMPLVLSLYVCMYGVREKDAVCVFVCVSLGRNGTVESMWVPSLSFERSLPLSYFLTVSSAISSPLSV